MINLNSFKHFIIISFLLFCAFINKFPENFFFASGDTWQITNFENFFFIYGTEWSGDNNGIQNTILSHKFYYYPFYIYEKFFGQIKPHITAFFFHFIFNLFTFYSFYFCLKILNLKISGNLRIILSFSYIFNIYVYYMFWYTWSYTPYAFSYTFVPLIVAIFFVILESNKFKEIFFSYHIYLLPIVSFLHSVSYGNIAFLINILILLCCILLLKIFFNIKKFYAYSFNFFIFLLFFFGGIISNTLSVIFGLKEIVLDRETNTNISSVFESWVISNSTNLPDPIFISDAIDLMKTTQPFAFFSIFYFLLIFIAIIYSRFKLSEKSIIFFIITLVLIFFMNKGIIIFSNQVISEFFTNSLLLSFRSSDKSALYLQFFVLVTAILIIEGLNKNLQKKFIITLVLISLSSSYPLFLGGIMTKHNLLIGTNVDFEAPGPGFRMIKKFPEEYIRVSEIMSKKEDFNNYRIMIWPYSVTSSHGWRDIPELKHRGANPINQLFKHSILETNSEIFLRWNYGEYLNKNENPDWTYNFMRNIGVKYIILLKKQPVNNVLESLLILNELTKKNLAKKIFSGNIIDLYEFVDTENINKYIYSPSTIFEKIEDHFSLIKNIKTIETRSKPEFIFDFHEKKLVNANFVNDLQIIYKFTLEDDFLNKNEKNDEKKLLDNDFYLNYEKINQSNYDIKLIKKNDNQKIIFTLNTRYSKFWTLSCKNCDKNDFFLYKNIFFNNYSNNFEIISNKKNLDLQLYYYPNKNSNVFLSINLIILIFSTLFFLILNFKKIYK